jgi:hypothetical protein
VANKLRHRVGHAVVGACRGIGLASLVGRLVAPSQWVVPARQALHRAGHGAWVSDGAIAHLLRLARVPIDEAGFTAYFAKALGRAMPGAEISISQPLELSVKRANDDPSTVYLPAIYASCRRSPEAAMARWRCMCVKW